MRTKICFVISFILTACAGYAQDIKLKDLKTPNSPGFQLLDISPSSIERPTNPKAVALSLFNLTANGTVIPKNFAIEVSPYWYSKPDDASIYKYLNINRGTEKDSFTGIYNKLSVSLSSTYNDSTSGSLLKNTNYISAGVRTNLLTLRSKTQHTKLATAITAISNRMGELKVHKAEKATLKAIWVKANVDIGTAENVLDADELALKAEQAKGGAADANVIKGTQAKILAGRSTIRNLEIKRATAELDIDKLDDTSTEELEQALSKDKTVQDNLKILDDVPVFQLDAAFAYAEAVPENVYANKRFGRSAFWVSGTLASNNISGTFAVKFMNDNVLVDTFKNVFVKHNSIDLGGRVEYKVKDISFSLEYINRRYTNVPILYGERTVGQIQFKISDGVYLTGSFGKNFGTGKNTFTLLGINWGLGKTVMSPDSLK